MAKTSRNVTMLSIRRLQLRIIKATRAYSGCLVSTIYLIYELHVHVASEAGLPEK